MQVLVFLWHLSLQQKVVSGGHRRFIEIARRATEHNVNYAVIENYPSLRLLNKELKYESIEFHIPLSKYEDFLLFRLLIWLYTTIRMAIIGVKVCRRRHVDLVMTPDGELFCMALPAYFAHAIMKRPLLFIVQQVPSGIPSESVVQEYGRYRAYGFGRILALSISIYAYASRNLLVKLYNRVPLVIAVSASLKRQLRAYGVKTNIHVLGNGIDLKAIDAVAYEGEKKYDAIFVGRHSPEKGIFNLIEVWRIVTEKLPNAILVLVGYSTREVLNLINKKIREYNLEKNIIIRGVVSDEEKILLMKQSKLLIYLSKHEAAPLTPAEALACGLPIVCHNIPPMRELYDCDAVIRCGIHGIEGVTKWTLNLLLDESLRKRLSKIAPRLVKKFDWETLAEAEFRTYTRSILNAGVESFTNNLSEVYDKKYFRKRYPKRVGILKKRHWFFYELPLLELEKLFSILRPSTIVDMGCGNGLITAELSKYANLAIGVDMSQYAVALAKRDFRSDKLDYIRGCIQNPCFKRSFTDVIVCLDILEHVDISLVHLIFNNFRDVMKKGGVLIIQVPFNSPLGKLVHILRGRKTIDFTNDPTHRWVLENISSMEEWLKKASFTPTKIIFIPFLNTIFSALRMSFIFRNFPSRLLSPLARGVYIISILRKEVERS